MDHTRSVLKVHVNNVEDDRFTNDSFACFFYFTCNGIVKVSTYSLQLVTYNLFFFYDSLSKDTFMLSRENLGTGTHNSNYRCKYALVIIEAYIEETLE